MTKELWLQKVKDSLHDLRALVRNYHPASVGPAVTPDMEITAPNAERASQVVRNLIRKETTVDTVQTFDEAIASCNVATLHQLFSSTWFGVPESTSCWNIPGFTLLVDLLDDPPEDDEQKAIHTSQDDTEAQW